MSDLAIRALGICAKYDALASEIKRLTEEIGGCLCPNMVEVDEPVMEGDDGALFKAPGESCFQIAKKERVPDHYNSVTRPLFIHEIAALPEVQACPACSRLCALIVERLEARKRWAACKRSIRAVGRRATVRA